MVWLQDQKWTIKDQEDLRAPETTNNLLKDFMGITNKTPATASKTSKTIQFLQARNSCKNSMKWFTFSFRKRSKKMIIGKISVLFSPALTAQVRVSIRSWNGSEATNISSLQMIAIVCMVQTLTWLCWAWCCLWRTFVSSDSNIFIQATRSKSKTPKSRSSFSSKWSFLPFFVSILILSINNWKANWKT